MDRKLLENASQPLPPESDGTPQPLAVDARRRKVMVALWERMSQLFGPTWENFFGTIEERTIHAWTDLLAGFTEMELAGAMKACAEWEEKFPPTLPQFRALCMAARSKAKPTWTDERIQRPKLEKHSHGDTGVMERELARQRDLDNCGETKEESYRKLGLHVRWGAL